MYCRNCSYEISNNAVICVHCGNKPLYGKKFCFNCGHITDYYAQICTSCGVSLNNITGEKNWLVTLLLAIFLGYLGIHRFYSGHFLIGIIQLLTGGGCGIWYIIDIILIVTNQYKDSNGNYLAKNF